MRSIPSDCFITVLINIRPLEKIMGHSKMDNPDIQAIIYSRHRTKTNKTHSTKKMSNMNHYNNPSVNSYNNPSVNSYNNPSVNSYNNPSVNSDAHEE